MPSSVRLGTKLETRLERLAQRTGRSKSLYIRRAVKEYLDDQEDYLIAAQRLEESLPSIPFEKSSMSLTYAVRLDPRAAAELRKLDRSAQERIARILSTDIESHEDPRGQTPKVGCLRQPRDPLLMTGKSLCFVPVVA